MSRKKRRKRMCPRHGAHAGFFCDKCDSLDFCPAHPECELREDGPHKGTCIKCEAILSEQINAMFKKGGDS